jgi:hypothetical protein
VNRKYRAQDKELFYGPRQGFELSQRTEYSSDSLSNLSMKKYLLNKKITKMNGSTESVNMNMVRSSSGNSMKGNNATTTTTTTTTTTGAAGGAAGAALMNNTIIRNREGGGVEESGNDWTVARLKEGEHENGGQVFDVKTNQINLYSSNSRSNSFKNAAHRSLSLEFVKEEEGFQELEQLDI